MWTTQVCCGTGVCPDDWQAATIASDAGRVTLQRSAMGRDRFFATGRKKFAKSTFALYLGLYELSVYVGRSLA
jgi:hypothetical protein